MLSVGMTFGPRNGWKIGLGRGEAGQPGVSKNLGVEKLEKSGEDIGTRCEKME